MEKNRVPGAPGTRHYSDREVQRQERRLRARAKAAAILDVASAAPSDRKLAMVAALVVRKLAVEHCDILLFASDRWVVVVRATNTGDAVHFPRRFQGEDFDLPVSGIDARVELIQLADTMASLDVLRTEGTVDRIHVFISRPEQLTPLGILTVESSTNRRLTTDERCLLDALGELIGAAVDSHALPTGDELFMMKQLRDRDAGCGSGNAELTVEY